MDNSKHCPQCGIELSPDAPAGLCPECLLKQGFNSEIDSQPMEKTAAMTGFIPPKPEELAEKFPHLEILELIGKGGMGAVYKARQPNLDRLVALKILPPEVGEDPAFAERFTREARALARLNHPHVVAVYDFGEADGLFYFLMEYVDGTDIRQLIQSGGINPQQALAIVPQICEALQFAHEEGIVHRDIKPENILVDKKGRVKIADFGLAKIFGGTDGSPAERPFTLTGTHQVMGTVHYMAPEQIEHPLEVDHRADIYSLGVVFYEMLTGELPIGRFAPPSEKVQIDVRLDEVVLRSLEKDPEKRYQHASDVKTDLDIISSTPREIATQTAPSGIAPTWHRKVSAHWNALSGLLVGVLVSGSVAMRLFMSESFISAPKLFVFGLLVGMLGFIVIVLCHRGTRKSQSALFVLVGAAIYVLIYLLFN